MHPLRAGWSRRSLYLFQSAYAQSKDNLLLLQRQEKQMTMLDEMRLANAYNNVAGILCAQGQYPKAELYNTLYLKIKKALDSGMRLALSSQSFVLQFNERLRSAREVGSSGKLWALEEIVTTPLDEH